ncbi:hypothetical protein [Actinosynnema sp. NPDC020468]|uniref:hypothetical protein n=1 Tax=Actinosynnema sp. NPDC020468 TaxID=3154488 RepID=UPI0033F15E56
MASPPAPHHPFPPAAPAHPTKFAGLAVAALVLGVTGLVCSLVPLLNILTAVGALVGAVLGIIALAGTRRAMAAIAVVLCVVAIVVSVMVQSALVNTLDGAADSGTVTPASASARAEGVVAPPPAARRAPTWGERYTWPGGLAVEVAAPTTCTPGRYAAPSDVTRAAKVAITVVNGSAKPFGTAVLTIGVDAQFNGRKADSIFDLDGPCDTDFESTTVLPGKSYTYQVSFAVTAEPGELQIALQPDFGSGKAIFVGQA